MNAPGANSISVAELTMALLLALARKIPAADASMKQGKWDKKSFLGEEVRGKTLGLAGLGRIGQEVARRARAFEMNVIAHDPFISANIARDLRIELVSLDELCQRADYLSLHMPATPETRHIFNAERLAACKKGLRIINTARGDLIDEGALADAIESGQIGGAALDVFQQEPTTDHRLQKLPQVVATPHIAASTREGQELVGVETATALRDYLKTGVIRNAVNFPSLARRRVSEAAAVRRRRPPARLACSGRWARRASRASASATTARWPAHRNPLIVSSVLEGLLRSDAVGAGHAGQRAERRRRARHRRQRIAQRAAAQLHQPAVGQAAHERRRALGRRHRRARRAAARAAQRRAGRCAARAAR